MLTVDADVAAGIPGDGRAARRAFDPRSMKKGGLDAAVLYLRAPATSGAILEGIDSLVKTIGARPDRAALALTSEDAYKLEKEGRRAIYLGLLYGDSLGTDIALLGTFHERGVRFLRLCSGSGNAICGGSSDRGEAEDRGLSAFGLEVVSACNRLGLVIDVGGASARSIADILAASRAPVVCTAGNLPGSTEAMSAVSEETAKAIAAGGGVVLVSFDPRRLVPPGGDRPAGVPDIADHILRLVEAIGAEAVGIGSGWGSHDGVAGCSDASEVLALTVELLRRGVNEHDLEAIWGGNVMRAFKRAVGGAAPER
jgi:membrane dipeptidase